MITTDDLERRLRSVLADTAPHREPETLFDSVMASTRTVRQRPGLVVALRSGNVGSVPRTSFRLAPVLLTALLISVLVGLLALAGSRLFAPPPEPPLSAAPGFAATGSMGVARQGATALLLTDGRILIVGGTDSDNQILRTAELYDPVAGTFTPTGPMADGRAGYTTMRSLADGRVLVQGGCCNAGPGVGSEIYDPVTGTFSATTGDVATPQTMQVGGRTLVVSPASAEDDSTRPWDPSAGWMSAQTIEGSDRYLAVRLADGRWLALALLSGANGPTMGAASIYDAATGEFLPVDGPSARHPYPVALLGDGRVLLAGDIVGNVIPPSAELFDPVTGTFEAVGAPASEGPAVQAARLPDGRVLVTFDPGPRTPELFDPFTGRFTVLDSPLQSRSYPTIAVLADGRILITGGADATDEQALSSAELYQPPTAKER